MPYVFGRFVLLDSDGDYFCEICLRWFYSEGAILAHCRSTTSHAWCDKCKRVLKTEHAKQEHLKVSPSHNMCFMCTQRPDFTSVEELNNHYNVSHFLCRSCDVYYDTEDRLKQHQMKVHEEKNLECPVCIRTFPRLSYILLHLERSCCSSASEINSLAQAFDYSDYYFTNYDCSSFICEDCDRVFDNLSGLLQHVEDTPDCSHLLQGDDSTLKSVAEYIFDHVAKRCIRTGARRLEDIL